MTIALGQIWWMRARNTVMLRTFSKIYGLSALRLGWGYCPDAVADVLNRVRGPFNVSSVAQVVGEAAVRDQVFVDKARQYNTQWLEQLTQELSGIGLIVHPSAGNFLLLEFSGGDVQANAAYDFLMEQGIILRKVGNYGLPHCLRLTIGTADENRAVVAAFAEFMS